jgi:hypothetical protein
MLIQKPHDASPGEGDAAETVNCRCTLLYQFFDTEQELQAWLGSAHSG